VKDRRSAIVFLAGDAAALATGSAPLVDGGLGAAHTP
jgi:hypothetical protein